jgi:hypothetical protein
MINRLSKILDLNKRKTYYGLVYPLLSYGIVVWGHSAKAKLQEFLPSKKGQ